jgi:hypothetical protein
LGDAFVSSFAAAAHDHEVLPVICRPPSKGPTYPPGHAGNERRRTRPPGPRLGMCRKVIKAGLAPSGRSVPAGKRCKSKQGGAVRSFTIDSLTNTFPEFG